MIKMIFVAHPMSGDIVGNSKKVMEICKSIHSKEVIPVFPSFTWRQYLEDGTAETKELAEAVNLEYFRRGTVDEVWFYGDHLSDGMKKEALMARSLGIPTVGKTPELKLALANLTH